MNELIILIPVYQGAPTVGDVVRGARATGHAVVVVDDGSTDDSGRVAEAAGAIVLRHPANHGKGAALQTGFAWAKKRGAAAVLTLDADGQHDPAEIPSLIAAHRREPDALVIGVRRFSEMPSRSRTGNRISTYWISKFARRLHADTQSGFRVYPHRLYAGPPLRSSRFATETELLLRAAKLHVPLVEVSVRTLYPPDGARTHFHDVRDTFRILGLVIASPLWTRSRTREPDA